MAGPARTATASVLFVDVVGSTEARSRVGEEAADALRRDTEHLLTEIVERHHGRVVKGLGDGVLASFDAAADAVGAGVAMQQEAPAGVQLRVGVSTGDVSFESGDVFGTPVVEASRLCAAARGEQILVADLVRALARGRGAHVFEAIGELTLKGLPEPVMACQVPWEPLVPVGGNGPPVPGPLIAGIRRTYVGRQDTLDKIGGAWQAVQAGTGSAALLLAGEPGVGKTRTAAELALQARAEGALVLYGTCDEGLSVPFQPFVEALEFHTVHDPAPVLGRLAGELTRLLPELAGRIPQLAAPVVSDPQTEEYRLFEAVTSWLVEASKSSGLVVVLDDLHWATRATLLLLVHALKGAAADPSARLLLVGTYRDTEVDRVHPLSAALADLRRLPSVARVDLSGLSRDEVVAFAENAAGHPLDQIGQRLVEAIYAETDGNPFFIGEVLRHLVETGQLQLVEGRWEVTDPDHVLVPEGVRDVIGRRLGRLSETANRVLAVASAVGRDFDLEVVGSVVDVDENAVLDGLDEACRARLVEETGPDRFRFAHAMVRDTLYAELSSTRRRRLHTRIADVLEKVRPHDATALAHHMLEAGPTGGHSDRAVSFLLAAAEQALAARAPAEAEACYAQALELLDDAELPDPVARVEAMCGLGEVQRHQGNPAFRRTLLDAGNSALAIERTDLTVRAAVANFRGMQSVIGAVDRERVGLLERAIAAVGDLRSTDVALLYATWAVEVNEDPSVPCERRLELADRAVAIAREMGNDRVLAEVLMRTSTAALVPERWASAVARATEAVTLADAIGDPSLRAMTRLFGMSAHLGVGDVDTARSLIEQATAIAAADCPPYFSMIVRYSSVQLLAYDGRLDEAERSYHRVAEFGRDIGSADIEQWAWVGVVNIEALRGRRGDRVDDILIQADDNPGSLGWRTGAVRALAIAGRHEEARRMLVEHQLDRPAAFAPHQFSFTSWTQLGIVAMRLGDAALGSEVETLLRPYQDLWSHHLVFYDGPISWFLGAAVAAQGRWPEAVALFDLADRALADAGLEPFRPVVAIDLARTLAASGDPEDRRRAREVAERERAAATARGLDRLSAQFDAVLARLT
jgi:class 3 adenylate cyclase/tetratricopeptide (TPR) repeat protein